MDSSHLSSSSSLSPLDYVILILLRPLLAIFFVFSLILICWFLAWKLVLIHIPVVQEILKNLRKKPSKKPITGRLSRFYKSKGAPNLASNWVKLFELHLNIGKGQHKNQRKVVVEETPLTPFLASESESSDSDEDFEGDSETDDYLSNEMNEIDEAELLDLNGEASNDDEDMEEDEIDPDELSYEDLIALGEFVGTENKGLSTDKIKSCITPYACKSLLEGKYGVDQCVICQTEYEEEEQVMTLPCDHMYHSECITTWLQIKKVCAICNTEISENLP